MAHIPFNTLLFLLVAAVLCGYSRWLLTTEHRIYRRSRHK